MKKVLAIGLMLLVSGIATADLNPGGFNIDSNVMDQIATHLAKECPTMFERETIEVTSYRTYKFDQIGRVFEIEILGRGYAVNDPHWDIAYQLEQDLNSGETVITSFESRGDCW